MAHIENRHAQPVSVFSELVTTHSRHVSNPSFGDLDVSPRDLWSKAGRQARYLVSDLAFDKSKLAKGYAKLTQPGRFQGK
jgi:hypothetical protein